MLKQMIKPSNPLLITMNNFFLFALNVNLASQQINLIVLINLLNQNPFLSHNLLSRFLTAEAVF